MGYSEEQYSLPRWEDISVSRQGMYDDLYRMLPTQGWMFVPLVQYHGGGAAAAFEPLSDHKLEYEWALAQYMGAGVAACYRGFRLYDSSETKDIVKKWTRFYRKYQDILTSDVIHVRKPDMQDIDSFMHVNHKLKICGLVMVFNPTNYAINRTLDLPLYYTGITKVALISEHDLDPRIYELSSGYIVNIYISLPRLSITWLTIQQG